jgi:NAD(P)-dependent dehydrogenase (short-subunit alcohol dehydrogenase family)
MGALDGRVAVVTGGGGGIGRAIAARLASDGARVAITGRDEGRLEESASAIGARPYRLDVRDEAACNQTMSKITKDLGPLSIVVANAGLGGANAPGAADRWREVVATNLDGTYFTLRGAIPHLAAPPARADLVVVSSILAKIGVPGYTAYCASKAGLLGLTRALALELAPRGALVNAICPGWVDTSMAQEGLRGIAAAMGTTVEAARAKAMESVPLGRMSKPNEVAALVAWVVSPECVGMTGQSIDLNNGAYLE